MSRPQNIKDILTQLPQVSTASAVAAASRNTYLTSNINELDEALGGGLPMGQLSEWGMPLGCGGREVFLPFLVQAAAQNPPLWCLWVYPSKAHLRINASAWQARGIDLSRIRFVSSGSPIHDLQPLLWDRFFRCIVFDMPQRLRSEEYAFLAKQAERNGQMVAVIRNYFLSSQRGNVWCRLRVNCWREAALDRMHLHVVRGLSPRQRQLVWRLA